MPITCNKQNYTMDTTIMKSCRYYRKVLFRGVILLVILLVLLLLVLSNMPSSSTDQLKQRLGVKSQKNIALKFPYPTQNHKCQPNSNNMRLVSERYADRCVEEALDMWYVNTALLGEANIISKQNSGSANASTGNTLTQVTSGVDISSVMMVWCGKKTFEFRHALNIISIFTFVRANNIVIFYDIFPLSDEYNQWIQFVMMKYPYLDFHFCEECCTNGTASQGWIRQASIETNEDLYVNFKTILAEYLSTSSLNDFKYTQQLVLSKKSFDSKAALAKCYSLNKDDIQQNKDANRNMCYHAQNLPLMPSDIWFCKSHFCNVSRLLMYGNTDTVKPIKHQQPVIPNIVHYIMFGKFTFSLTFYMSILSFIHIGKVSKVYIHCDNQPTGKYWLKLHEHVKGTNVLELVHRMKPKTVFNQKINKVQHSADTVKAEIMNKYGGIFSDGDLLLINPLDAEYYKYEFVMSRDHGRIRSTTVNMGMLMSRPNSVFSQIYIDVMRSYRDKLWLWNSGQMPFKMIEYNPQLVYISPKLQLICARLRCDLPKNVTEEVVSLEQWQKHAYGLHFVYPDPFNKENKIKSGDNFIAELGRYILAKAQVTL